jgi:hypothetical protein
MKKSVGVLLGSVITGTVGYVLYKEVKSLKKEINKDKIKKQEEIDRLEGEIIKQDIQNKTDELIVTTFIQFILEDFNITLEQAILKFENIEGKTLDEYAKNKMRNKESYLKIYEKHFKKAKDILLV